MMEEIKGYDEWKTQPYEREPRVTCICEHCNEDVYEGEEVSHLVDGVTVHSDCFYDYAVNTLIEFSGPAEVCDEQN